MEVVDTCWQLVRVVGMGLYHSTADVQSMVQFGGIIVVQHQLIEFFIGRGCDALCKQCSDHADLTAWTD